MEIVIGLKMWGGVVSGILDLLCLYELLLYAVEFFSGLHLSHQCPDSLFLLFFLSVFFLMTECEVCDFHSWSIYPSPLTHSDFFSSTAHTSS